MACRPFSASLDVDKPARNTKTLLLWSISLGRYSDSATHPRSPRGLTIRQAHAKTDSEQSIYLIPKNRFCLYSGNAREYHRPWTSERDLPGAWSRGVQEHDVGPSHSRGTSDRSIGSLTIWCSPL